MIRRVALSCVLLVCAASSARAQGPAPIVFFDIAGPVTSPLSSLFREDPAEIVIYIGVSDITATLAKVVVNGGRVEFPRLVVPGRVVIGMFRDPAGTKVGLVEIANGKPKVP